MMFLILGIIFLRNVINIHGFIPYPRKYHKYSNISHNIKESNAINTRIYMATKKVTKKKKQNSQSSTKKGFGLAPPTLEELVSKFQTRFPNEYYENDANESFPCKCNSGKSYKDCCQFYHTALEESLSLEKHTPVDLLRSRYTAFAYRLPLYIMESTHETCRDYRNDRIAWVKDLNKSGMFDSYEFIGLENIGEIEYSNDEKDEAFVSFEVRLRAHEDTGSYVEGQEIVIREKSRFLRDGNPLRWRYSSGEVTSKVAGMENIILNT